MFSPYGSNFKLSDTKLDIYNPTPLTIVLRVVCIGPIQKAIINKHIAKNIFILDEQSQNAILFNLSTFYNTLDFDFWLLVSDRPVDISLYLNELQVEYNKNPNSAIRKLIMQDINKANLFMSRDYNVVDTEYTFLFKEKKMELVQKKLHTLISGLSNAGLNSTQTSNADLRMLLDNYLNDGISTNFRAVM